MQQFQIPYEYFSDVSNGEALMAGYVYIGEVNQNPETNPLNIYWDSEGTQPAAQPLRTSGGYIVRNGTPAIVYFEEYNYSLTVRDKNGVIIYTSQDVSNVSNLQNSLIQLAYTGQITMLKNADGDWVVFNASGNLVNTSGSTTEGAQEALDLSCPLDGTRGYPLRVIGGNPTTGGLEEITCSNSLNLNPLNGKSLTFKEVKLKFTSALSNNPGLQINSFKGARLEMPGSQISYAGTGWAVSIDPADDVPGENAPDLVSSYLHFGAIFFPLGSTPTGAFKVDPDLAPLHGVQVFIDDVLGQDIPAKGIQLITGAHSINNNIFQIGRVFGITGTLIEAGTSTTEPFGSFANKFIVGQLCSGNTSNPVVRVYHKKSYFNIGINGAAGTSDIGIQLESSASKNIFDVLDNQSTIEVVDNSITKDNVGMYGPGASCGIVNLNNVNQTGVLNNTATLVTFSNAIFNEDTAFNTTTNRWGPNRTGAANISATVMLTAGVINTALHIYIYKNGSPLLSVNEFFQGNNPQSISINQPIFVTATTDYFQIYVLQVTGSTQSIDGDVTKTYAAFEMSGRR